MRYPPHLLDEIRARLSVSHVVSRKVALKKSGREFRGLSPFKSEKSPSFFVNDQKGFYHCFASGEHGDIFTFLMKTEGLSFPEAVERLAEDAGVSIPKPTEAHREVEDLRSRLLQITAETQVFFHNGLAERGGQHARDYLERRGVKRSAIDAFGIGFGPDSRDRLKSHLAGLGYSVNEMITAGVVVGGEDIPTPYDRFRNRVMFPIADAKGRVIAFGGRALDPRQPAKYHNSPETPLFHKGATLFNLHRARPIAHERGRMVVVEGYMDVVALAEAGFGEAVAPLGTALTEEQIQLLWHLVPEPILCFDGDSAGRKAAYRAIDVMMPHLKPGTSARFAFLPDGLDPDDLVRQQGAGAVDAVLDRARALDEVLFEREWQAGQWSTPERRAHLEQRLRALTDKISHPSVRTHYERAMKNRLFEVWGGGRFSGSYTSGSRPKTARGEPWGSRQKEAAANRNSRSVPFQPHVGQSTPQPAISESLKRSGMVAGEAVAPPYREALLIGALVNHPWLLAENLEEVAALPLTSQVLDRLRARILELAPDDNSLDTAMLQSQLKAAGLQGALDLLERALTHRSDKFVDIDADPAAVESGWRHTLAVHERFFGLQRQLEAAERAFHDEGSDEAWGRIREIKVLLGEQKALEFPPDP